MPHRSWRSRPRRSGWRLKPERSNPSSLCRRVLGSSPAPLSQRSLLNPSPNGRGKIQSTPQDRIPTSKTSSHQSHSQMGVPMHGYSRSRKIASDGEMPLAEHDNAVKTFPPDRTDRPFTISVLPRRSRRGWPIPNAHRPKAADEDVSVDGVAVTNDVSRRYFPTIGLGELVRNPFSRLVRAHSP